MAILSDHLYMLQAYGALYLNAHMDDAGVPFGTALQRNCVHPWERTHATAALMPNYRKHVRLDALPDIISSAPGDEIVMSERCLELLSRVTLCDAIGHIPLDITTEKGEHVVTYALVFSSVVHDVLDPERSIVGCYTGTKVVKSVQHWVLREDVCPEADLFLGHIIPSWVGSQELKNLFDAHLVTGIRWRCIYPPDESESYH